MKRTVLVIDHNEAIRFLLQTTFSRTYRVITAADGYSAMSWLAGKISPDLIIAAPALPDMKDWELIEYLASSGFYRHVPLIVLSDDSEEHIQSCCTKLGIEKFFRKPFNPLNLKEVADNLTSSNRMAPKRFLKLV